MEDKNKELQQDDQNEMNDEETGFEDIGLDFLETIAGGAVVRPIPIIRPIIRPRLLNVIPADLIELLEEESEEKKNDEEKQAAVKA